MTDSALELPLASKGKDAAGAVPHPHTPHAGARTEPVLRVVVIGMPGPQGSKSAFRNPATGRIQQKESSAKVKPWRQDVAAAAVDVLPAGWQLLDGALHVDMTFTLPKPSGAPKTRTTYPRTRPDVSKLARSTEDALSKVVWTDDARIVELCLAKRYPNEGRDALPWPGAVITIWPVT